MCAVACTCASAPVCAALALFERGAVLHARVHQHYCATFVTGKTAVVMQCCLWLQVYKAVLRGTGEEVAVKVQRPNVAPVILRDLFIFRSMARFVNPICKARLPGRCWA